MHFLTPHLACTRIASLLRRARVGRGVDPARTVSAGAPAAALAASSSSGPGGGGAGSLLGSLVLVAGFSGRIYVYENLPPTM